MLYQEWLEGDGCPPGTGRCRVHNWRRRTCRYRTASGRPSPTCSSCSAACPSSTTCTSPPPSTPPSPSDPPSCRQPSSRSAPPSPRNQSCIGNQEESRIARFLIVEKWGERRDFGGEEAGEILLPCRQEGEEKKEIGFDGFIQVEFYSQGLQKNPKVYSQGFPLGGEGREWV